MQKNSNNSFLLTSCIDINSTFPAVCQALQIVVYNQMQTYEVNMNIIEKFGEIEPFTTIVKVQKQQYSMILPLLEKYQIQLPNENEQQEVNIPNSLLEVCELGVATELKNIQLYDYLLQFCQDCPDIQEAFYRLQATSYNDSLPMFRKCTQAIYSQAIQQDANAQLEIQKNSLTQNLGIPSMDENIEQLEEFQQMASQLSSGKINQDELLKLLGNKNISFIGGALLGAISATVISQLLSNKNQDEGEN